MNYTFQFGSVWAALPRLAQGAQLTVLLSLAAIAIGLAIGVLCAPARTSRRAGLRWPAAVSVESIRNTPFLIQLFFFYFGLASRCLRLYPIDAALVGMSINCGA